MSVSLRAVFPWRVLLAAILLSLLCAATFASVVASESSVASAGQGAGASHELLSSLPLAAQEAVSRTLGASDHAYRISSTGLGFQALSPAQRLGVQFDRSRILIKSGELNVRLALRAAGYGAALGDVGAGRMDVRANRVLYSYPGFSAWYVNGPLGLEQGFTLPRAPSDSPAGPFTLSFALSGNAHVSLASGGRSLTISRPGGPTLRYYGLVATDAGHRQLHSWLELSGGRVLLRVDTHGARYPLRIDPLVQQGERLVGGGQSGAAEFGYSVALSSDGDTALVGGPADDGGIGAVWAFTRSGSTWMQQGPKFTGANESGAAEFGHSVALSPGGETALIGGPGDNSGVGAAWVFTLSGGMWIQQGEKLTGGGESGEGRFGGSVALSAEGNAALIGGPEDNSAEPGSGAAWVFNRSGSAWNQSAELTGGKEEVGRGKFGSSVALSADGEIALIGAPVDSPHSFAYAGAVWAFALSGSTWSQLGAALTVPNNEDGLFGSSVALSAEGDTALVGGDGGGIAPGAAWVFTRSGFTWSLQSPRLTGEGESRRSAFGYSAALSADGNVALVGGPFNEGGSGAVWEFARSGSTWSEQGPELNVEAAGGVGDFGDSVALTAEGDTALIGGLGAVLAFGSPPIVTTGGATGVGATAATLNGEVNPEGVASNVHFQYGTTTSYGTVSSGQSVSGAPGSVAIAVAGLAPGTTYHFRIVAESSAGVSYGADSAFTTAPMTSSAPPPPANTSAPAITGTPIRGRTLSVSRGSWSNSPSSFAYQWQRCDTAGKACVDLGGETGADHSLAQGDVGHRLRAVVTAANLGGSASATSAVSAVVGSQVESGMTWTFGWSRRYSIVESLVVHGVPARASVEVLCVGRGCPFARDRAARVTRRGRCRGPRCEARRRTHSRAEVSLTALFKGRHVGVGTRISVNVVESGWIGKSFVFTVRSNQTPRVQIGCLAPGSTSHPGAGC
jgi:hypothetical protein